MELSITTLIVLGATVGFLGFFVGTLFGTFSRLFFRSQFKDWVSEEMTRLQLEISNRLDIVDKQTAEAVAAAHIQTQAIYKAAAEHAAQVKLPGTTGKGTLN